MPPVTVAESEELTDEQQLLALHSSRNGVASKGLSPSISSTAEEYGEGKDEDGAPGSTLVGVQAKSDQDLDISSVITQVTHVGPSAYRGRRPLQIQQQHNLDARSPWSQRFRGLLCCFLPGKPGYVKQEEQVAIRNVQPPIPVPSANRDCTRLIGPARDDDTHKKTLVLDLDETLVHSSFKPIANPDYIIPVEIDGKMVDVYVLKRPYLDHFMESIGNRFEIVVFTASLAKYADPLLDLLDSSGVVRWRLFRDACFPYEGNYVKDLSVLGRDLSSTIIVDNSPHSYVFQPGNAMPISTFIDNLEDQELLELLPLLAQVEHVDDVRPVLGMQQQRLQQEQQQQRFIGC